MTPEQKMLHLFELEHGPATGSCTAVVTYDEDGYTPNGVDLVKDGDVCWHASRESLVFAYVTRDIKRE